MNIYVIISALLFSPLAFAEPLPENQAEKLATAVGLESFMRYSGDIEAINLLRHMRQDI